MGSSEGRGDVAEVVGTRERGKEAAEVDALAELMVRLLSGTGRDGSNAAKVVRAQWSPSAQANRAQ